MNRLKGHVSYLIGSMDESKDTAHIWRQDISNFLWEHQIGVLNPCDKPSGKQEGADFTDYIDSLKEQERYDEVTEEMSPIVRIDLHMVDLSNFIIMAIDKDVHMCGSYGEQTYSSLEKKPIIVFCKQGKSKIPNWLFGTGMRHNMFFQTLDEVKEYILHICYDEEVDDLGRWRFIDYDKVFGK